MNLSFQYNSQSKILSQLSTQEILIFPYDFQNNLKRIHFQLIHYTLKKLHFYGFQN